jgi:hypothetical protein
MLAVMSPDGRSDPHMHGDMASDAGDANKNSEPYGNSLGRLKGKDRKLSRNPGRSSPNAVATSTRSAGSIISGSSSTRSISEPTRVVSAGNGGKASAPAEADASNNDGTMFGSGDYEDAAVEAAVMIAFQVASRSTSAEQLLKILAETAQTPAHHYHSSSASSTHASSSLRPLSSTHHYYQQLQESHKE